MSFDYTWIMSAITITGMWLAGNKTPWAWVLGIGNQALWLLFIVQMESWGLLPMLIALLFVYGRNLWKWRVS